MRSITLAIATLALALPATARQHDQDRHVAGGGQLAPGWMVRTDRGQGHDHIKFSAEGNGWDITVGPAVTLYRESDTASGDYTVSLTVEQLSSKGHGHGAGLIFGGRDLQSPDWQYSYILIRGDGSYIIKTRTGSTTKEIVGWTRSEAIHASELAHMKNDITVQVTDGDIIFSVNGTEIRRVPRDQMYTDGIVGFRLNHNLDMHLDSFTIAK